MHTDIRASELCQLDDATIDIDVDRCPPAGRASRATVTVGGALGPRSAGAMRSVLDALDSVTGAVRVRAEAATEISDEFVAALFEAVVRRRELGLPGLLFAAPDARLRVALAAWTAHRGVALLPISP